MNLTEDITESGALWFMGVFNPRQQGSLTCNRGISLLGWPIRWKAAGEILCGANLSDIGINSSCVWCVGRLCSVLVLSFAYSPLLSVTLAVTPPAGWPWPLHYLTQRKGLTDTSVCSYTAFEYTASKFSCVSCVWATVRQWFTLNYQYVLCYLCQSILCVFCLHLHKWSSKLPYYLIITAGIISFILNQKC